MVDGGRVGTDIIPLQSPCGGAIWQAVVLILKGEGDYCNIGIVEVVWKTVAAILNRLFTASIT